VPWCALDAAAQASWSVQLWQRLLARPASESGCLCPVARAHGRGGRRQRGL